MKRMQIITGTGLLFFCLGGWGYNVQASPVSGGKWVSSVEKNAAQALLARVDRSAANRDALPLSGSATTGDGAAATAGAKKAAALPHQKIAGRPAPTTNLKTSHVHVSTEGLVEMHVENMDIATILNLLSRRSHKNIITSRDVRGKVSVDLYDVSFYQALRAILTPNGFGYIQKGNFIYVYTAKQLAEMRREQNKKVNRIFRLHYIDAADAAALIKPLLSTGGQIAMTPAAQTGLLSSSMGGSSGGMSSGGGMGGGGGSSATSGSTGTGSMGSDAGEDYSTDDILVIRDYPSNIASIANAIKELDVRPKQVLIGCTVLRTDLTDSNTMGVNLASLSGVDFGSLTGASATTSSGAGRQTPGILNAFQNGTVPQPSNAQALVGTGGTGLSVGFLSDNISVFVQALESVSDTTTVADPKVLALNKQVADIHVGQNIAYENATQTATSTTQSVSFLSVGTELSFRPFIENDGYIRMDIEPQISSAFFSQGATIPSENTTTVTSNLMVKDGRTVVIGGLIQEQNSSTKGQVPILGDIPVLGIPFRNTNDQTTRTETMFLITPHVINDNTAWYHQSQRQARNVRRMMLGSRADLQPWSEDRLAQIWYADARRALRHGHRAKALMYTNWSLNTEPTFLGAIRLREKLTHETIQRSDTSSMRGFVRAMIREDQGRRGRGWGANGSGNYKAPLNINMHVHRPLAVPPGAP